jgi:hypothetical protein
LDLRALLCIQELNNVETLWLREPTHVVFGNEELVLSLWWRDQRTQEIDLVLSDGPTGREGILSLLALLCSRLSLVDRSLSSGLAPGGELLLSCNGSGLVLLTGEFLLLREVLFALLVAVGSLLALLLDFFDEYLLFVLQLSVPGLGRGLCFSVLSFLCLLLSRLGSLGNMLFLFGEGLAFCAEGGLLLL